MAEDPMAAGAAGTEKQWWRCIALNSRILGNQTETNERRMYGTEKESH